MDLLDQLALLLCHQSQFVEIDVLKTSKHQKINFQTCQDVCLSNPVDCGSITSSAQQVCLDSELNTAYCISNLVPLLRNADFAKDVVLSSLNVCPDS